MTESERLFARAQAVLPGGVNSPVRAFGAVGGTPPFIQRGEGSKIYDVDGKQYIDYVCSWGPLLFGHCPQEVLEAVRKKMENGLSFGAPSRVEVEMAEMMVSMLPGMEMVRMVNSGTEAVMSALRLARGVTGRDKIVKFAGCYHGHSDSLLVRAGSGVLTDSLPDSMGVSKAAAADTLTAEYNQLSSVESLFEQHGAEIAAIVVEPVAANMGVIPPQEGFLQGLRAICDRYGALLVFDEVITGFRLAPGGAQEYYGIQADIAAFGKIIGGGMPVGAYAARRDFMKQVAPSGGIYQAGTLSGNPVAMAAGLAQLSMIQDRGDRLYQMLTGYAEKMAEGLEQSARENGISVTVNREGSLFSVFFHDGPVQNERQAKESDTQRFKHYFHGMLSRGIYLAPSQFEAVFVSAAHTQKDLEKTLAAADEVMRELAGLQALQQK